MIKKLAIVLLSFVLGLTLSVAARAKDGVDRAKKIINIVGYDSLTGKFGDYGTTNQRGQQVAIDEINAAGGIASGPLKGYKLQLSFLDDRGDPQEAANVAKQIAAGDYLVATGPTISTDALAATPVLNRAGVPNIITYSNASTITQQGFNNILRLCYTTGNIAEYIATQVKDRFKKDTVAIISDNQSYGQQLVEGFEPKAKELGIKIVSHSVTTPSQNDFKAMLMEAKLKNPGVLLLFMTSYNDAGMLVQQARAIGFEAPIYVLDAETQPKFFTLAGNLKNTYIELPPSIDIKRPEVQQLKAEWNKKYPGFPALSGVYGYDAIKVVAAVIEKGGITRKSFIDKMHGVKIKGLANPEYAFAKDGDTSTLPPFVTQACQEYYDTIIKKTQK